MESRKHGNLHAHSANTGGDGFSPIMTLRSALLGLAATALAAVMLLMVGAGIAYSSSDPSALELPIAIAVLYISLFAGGLTASKTARSSRLLGGVFFTALALLLLLLLKLLLAGSNGSGISGATAYLIGAVASALGGSLIAVFTSGIKRTGKKKRATKFGKKK